jgi:PAS domain S-box-containing protein
MDNPGPAGPSPDSDSTHSQWRRRVPLSLAAVAGLILTMGAFFFARNASRERLQPEFARSADVPATALQRDIDDHVYLLRSINAFYFSSRNVDRNEFAGFVKDALARLKGLAAVEWIPRVSAAGRAAHEQSARAEGFPAYEVNDSGPQGTAVRAPIRAEYLPIYYVEPATNRALLGRDLALDPDAAMAMSRARDEGVPTAGSFTQFTSASNAVTPYRIFAAIYTNQVTHGTAVERHQNLAGYAAAIIDLDQLLDASMEHTKPGEHHQIVWELLDQTGSTSAPVVIHRSAAWTPAIEAAPEIEAQFSFDVAGRSWLLRCRPTTAYLAAHRSLREWGVLVGGLLVTTLATLYLSSTLGRAAQVERLVESRTTELAQRNRELKEHIARRQQMEAALAAERDLIDALLNSMPDHIYFKDRDSHFIRINKSMATLFKLQSPDEALGKSDSDFFTAEHAQRAFADEQDIMRTGRPLVGREERETWPDGSVTWVSTTKQCLKDKAGTTVGTFGISRDITPRKRAENRLAAQYQVARILAESTEFKAAAPRILEEICQCLGWSVGAVWEVNQAARLLRCVELWHAPSISLPEFAANSRQTTFAVGIGLPGRVWKSGEPAWIPDVVADTNFPRAPIDIKEKLHGAFGFPLRAGNEVLGVIEFFSRRIEQPDEELLQMVTTLGNQIGQFIERKRMEQALASKAEELERSNRELEQFAYVASHDLQEPLRMISSYTQLLERRYKDKLDADAHEFISFAVDGAARMQSLINDLLAYSRVGTRAKEFKPTDCAEVLRRALKNLEVAIEESEAKITHTDLPTVTGDITQLTQLFQNLIGNDIKFRGNKPAAVHVSAQLEGDGTVQHWQFAVRDEGIGIDPQYFERIFVIFQRLHGREDYPGTGIGLAVCKKIVERHGGHIWVESESGQGSTFHFTIPKS